MLKLWLDNGYLNTEGIRASGYPFIFITSARGIGKTYGELFNMPAHRTLLVRYTQVQLEALCTGEGNPFIKINADHDTNYGMKMTSKYIAEIGKIETDKKGRSQIVEPFGAGIALSTFHNIRSFGGSQYDRIFFDEFIPDTNARLLKDEAGALFNLYESLNRSREFEGNAPVQLLGASNSNTINNAIYLEFGLIPLYDRMQKHGWDYCADDRRGVLLIRPRSSKVVEAKRETALYRLTEGTRFAASALDNEFSEDVIEEISHEDLRQYVCIARVSTGGQRLLIYLSKSKLEYYVRAQNNGGSVDYTDAAEDRRRFFAKFAYLRMAMLEKRIKYAGYAEQVAFKGLIS